MQGPGDMCRHVRRYERRYIERWLAGGSSTCPATGTVLAAPVSLTPNVALRKSIEVWAEKHATWLLVRSLSFPSSYLSNDTERHTFHCPHLLITRALKELPTIVLTNIPSCALHAPFLRQGPG